MRVLLSILLAASLGFTAAANTVDVKKQRFTLDSFTTANGQTIAPVNIG